MASHDKLLLSGRSLKAKMVVNGREVDSEKKIRITIKHVPDMTEGIRKFRECKSRILDGASEKASAGRTYSQLARAGGYVGVSQINRRKKSIPVEGQHE